MRSDMNEQDKIRDSAMSNIAIPEVSKEGNEIEIIEWASDDPENP